MGAREPDAGAGNPTRYALEVHYETAMSAYSLIVIGCRVCDDEHSVHAVQQRFSERPTGEKSASSGCEKKLFIGALLRHWTRLLKLARMPCVSGAAWYSSLV